MVTVAEKILPGHGRMREVRVTAERLSLQAEVV
jgi:propanediol dehydratase small subunit